MLDSSASPSTEDLPETQPPIWVAGMRRERITLIGTATLRTGDQTVRPRGVQAGRGRHAGQMATYA